MNVDRWGKRRLAYQIKQYLEGSYALLTFRMAPGAARELERSLEISEDVIRYLMVKRSELGLTEKHCLYSCRHTFIVRKLIETNGDISLVAEMAGNSVQVIERHYKKWGAQRRRILEALGNGRPELQIVDAA